MTPATRAQMSDALDLVNAYIDARTAHDLYRTDASLDNRHAWHTAGAHADELLEVFHARYPRSRDV